MPCLSALTRLQGHQRPSRFCFVGTNMSASLLEPIAITHPSFKPFEVCVNGLSSISNAGRCAEKEQEIECLLLWRKILTEQSRADRKALALATASTLNIVRDVCCAPLRPQAFEPEKHWKQAWP
ncbi:hypothetical protein CLAIMM_13876 [Cladophialophora immunda]|nr:hypothetical protein CLAIMM_13876 [Cladophialophora immunda]